MNEGARARPASRWHCISSRRRPSTDCRRGHASRAARISSATRTTCTISSTAWTRTMCAPARTAAVDRRGRAPVALAGRPLAERRRGGTTCATARPAAAGRAPRTRRRRAAPAPQAVLGPLGEAEAGVEDDALARRRRRPRPRSMLALSSRATSRDDVVVAGLRVHRRASGRGVHQDEARRRARPRPRASAGS